MKAQTDKAERRFYQYLVLFISPSFQRNTGLWKLKCFYGNISFKTVYFRKVFSGQGKRASNQRLMLSGTFTTGQFPKYSNIARNGPKQDHGKMLVLVYCTSWKIKIWSQIKLLCKLQGKFVTAKNHTNHGTIIL